MTSILEGLKVIEMGHFVAVPAAGVMLADWGADVIKIEPLIGDAARSIYMMNDEYTLDTEGINYRFEIQNRNKKSMAIDLSRNASRDIMCKLIQKADVFISNYEQGTLHKFRLDYANLSKLNARLVYATITGYGTKGAEKDERGFDATAGWARAGIQHLLADGDSAPPQVLTGMVDRVAGSNLIAGVLAGLFNRMQTGKGQEIELSLYHTGIWMLAGDIQMALTGNKPLKNDRANRINPLVNTYRTKDNRWIQLAMYQPHLHWSGFCRALGRPELEHDDRFPPDQLVTTVKNRRELVHILNDTFATSTLADWGKRLKENNCIFSCIWTPEEVVKDPQARINDMFLPVEYPGVGKSESVNTPVRFVGAPIVIKENAPEIGQHTEEILLELGYDWEEIAEFKEQHAIL